MTIPQRVAALRLNMKQKNVEAYIIPSSDPHQSEYVADCWKYREWISGFDGSAGTVVITADFAGLWTDARYFLEAETLLKGSGILLQKLVVQGTPEENAWLVANLPKGSTVAIDGQNFSIAQVESMKNTFGSQLNLVTDADLLTPIWKDRPTLPINEAFEHDIKYTGRSRAEKLADVRTKMVELGCNMHLVTSCDDIAWMLNMRGSDVESNPLAIAYAVVKLDSVVLFINKDKITTKFKTRLAADGVTLAPYESIAAYVASLQADTTLLIDKDIANQYLFDQLPSDVQYKFGSTPARMLKAIKNDLEIAHIRRAMAKDGAALTRAMMWLEATLPNRTVSEVELAAKIAECRAAMPLYFCESFGAIIGYRANGASMHYHPKPGSCADIKNEGMLLMDSGGQYLDGTTDITRTISLSPPTETQKLHYTLVLKGHIALAMQRFPAGTRGAQLDTLARMALWQHALNFGHGTGHGVGFFLNVHEPPQGFQPALGERGRTVHEVGMLSSNEPGFYLNEAYGIRIENLLICTLDEKNDFGQFLRFETVTLFPIDTTLIDRTLLSRAERTWLNDYHRQTYKGITPLLKTPEEKAWLKAKCRAI